MRTSTLPLMVFCTIGVATVGALTISNIASARDKSELSRCRAAPDPARGCATKKVFDVGHNRSGNVRAVDRRIADAMARSGLASSATWVAGTSEVPDGLYVGTPITENRWLHVPANAYGKASDALAPFEASGTPTYGGQR